MNYTIYTLIAARLKKEILERVSEKVDANGKGIATCWLLRPMVLRKCLCTLPTSGQGKVVWMKNIGE